MGKTHFSGPVLVGDTSGGSIQGVATVVFKPVFTALNTSQKIQNFPDGALVKDVIAFPVGAGAASSVTVKLGTAAGGVQVFTAAITGITAVNARVPVGETLYAELSVGAAPPYVLYITVVA